MVLHFDPICSTHIPGQLCADRAPRHARVLSLNLAAASAGPQHAVAVRHRGCATHTMHNSLPDLISHTTAHHPPRKPRPSHAQNTTPHMPRKSPNSTWGRRSMLSKVSNTVCSIMTTLPRSIIIIYDGMLAVNRQEVKHSEPADCTIASQTSCTTADHSAARKGLSASYQCMGPTPAHHMPSTSFSGRRSASFVSRVRQSAEPVQSAISRAKYPDADEINDLQGVQYCRPV